MASLMNKSPLEGDGLIENLYHYLWEKDGLDRGPTGVRIPDTVVFKLRSPVAWYFTSSKDSTIKRKRSVNMTMAKIEEGVLSNRGSSGVVAYFIDSKSLSAAGPQIEYFDEDGLKQFLKYRKKPLSGILQKFVEPKGGKNSMIRAVWAPKLCLCERRENTKRLWDTRYSIFERTVTFEGKPHNSILTPVRGSALPRQVQGICESVVFHVAQVTSLKCRVSRMVLSIKTDAEGRLWMLWASSLRTEGAKLEVATADAVMGKAGSRSPTGIAALKKATRDGLTAPQSVMGPLSLTSELQIPRQRQPDLEGLTPVLAPGVQMAGASTGKARRAGAGYGDGADFVAGGGMAGASSGAGGGDGFASLAAESAAMSESRHARRGGARAGGASAATYSAGVGVQPSDLAELDAMLADADAAASRLSAPASDPVGEALSDVGIAQGGERRRKRGGGRGRGRRNSLVLDNEQMQEIAEAGDFGPPKPATIPTGAAKGKHLGAGAGGAGAAGGSVVGRANEEASRAAETAWLSPLRNQNTGVERGLLASSLRRDLTGLPVLGERQCLSCGAAKPPGVKAGPVSGRSAGSRPAEGFAVQYKTVIQHHTALLEELGLDAWWQVDGTVPSDGDDGDGAGAGGKADAITAAQAALSAEDAFDTALGIRAHGEETKQRREGPPPAHECSASSMWPAQTGLVVSAAGGVGMYGVLPDGEEAGPGVPVHPIPQVLRLVHPTLTCADYRWYMQDPLFLYKTVEVCEACLLVYAKFAQCITESKPPEFALRQCMGPRAANRVSRALLAGLLPGQQDTGAGRGADARAKKRAATRSQQEAATARLHALSGSLASIPESGAAGKGSSSLPASRARNPRHRDAFTDFFAAQEPPSMPGLSTSQASIMKYSPRGSSSAAALPGEGMASSFASSAGGYGAGAGAGIGIGGSVPNLPPSQAMSLARGWSAAPEQWHSSAGQGGMSAMPRRGSQDRFAPRTAPHGAGMGVGGAGAGAGVGGTGTGGGMGISTSVTNGGLGLTGMLGRNGLPSEAPAQGKAGLVPERGPVMHSGHPLGFMAADRPGNTSRVKHEAAGAGAGAGAGGRRRMASDVGALSGSGSSSAALVPPMPSGSSASLARIRTANARPQQQAFAGGAPADSTALRHTMGASGRLGTAGLRVTFSPDHHAQGAGAGFHRLGSAGSLGSGGIHTPLASTGALVVSRGGQDASGSLRHGSMASGASLGAGSRTSAVGASPMRSPGGKRKGAPVPVQERKPFDNHHGPGASAHIENHLAAGTSADHAHSDGGGGGGRSRGAGGTMSRSRKSRPKLPKSSPFYAAVEVPRDEHEEKRIRRARAVAKQRRDLARFEAERKEKESSGWGSKSSGAGSTGGRRRAGAGAGNAARGTAGSVPLSERYGDKYDEEATAAGTATRRGVEASRAAAEAERERMSARLDPSRDPEASKHKDFLEDTKRAVEAQLSKRDQLIELLGYNPVQDEAAKVIQGAAKKKLETNRVMTDSRM